jgi:uncharacterized protein
MKDKLLNPKIKKYGNDILISENFKKMKDYKQHGDISVLSHSLRVAQRSLKFAAFMNRHNIIVDEQAVVRGALLHDYFLYDWHEKDLWHNWHGFRHASTALRNADKEYELTDMEREIILKHMFPLNIRPPRCKEAWIVNLADTYCSAGETFMGRKPHDKRRKKIISKARKQRERVDQNGRILRRFN